MMKRSHYSDIQLTVKHTIFNKYHQSLAFRCRGKQKSEVQINEIPLYLPRTSGIKIYMARKSIKWLVTTGKLSNPIISRDR